MSKDDVAVCGTGIAGLACALGLAQAGLRVALVGPRKTPAPAQADVYCPRVYALSPGSRRLLQQLGAWGLLDSRRVTAVESMQVYGDAGGSVSLHAWQAVRPALAWIVESTELERVLQQAMQVCGIAWHDESFHALEDGGLVTGAGSRLRAGLVVGADGARSPVRTAAGIRHTSRAYGETGLVAHLACDQPHGHAARQWFTSDGVLALLPMPDTAQGHQVSMVWSMPDALAAELQAMPYAQRDAALQVRLAAATGGALGVLSVRGPVHGFPLFLEKSDMVAPGVALVGDAAHRVHPLAGQGLNLGLGDAEELARVMRGKPTHCGAGQLHLLRRYRRARAEPVLAMGLATDGLHRLFSLRAAPIAMARNIGMQWVDRLPFVKRRLIAGASGGQASDA